MKTPLPGWVQFLPGRFLWRYGQTQPEIYDNVDEDISVKCISEFAGAPQEIIRSAEAIAKVRSARAQQQAEDKKFQMQIEAMKAAGHLKGLAPQQPAPGVQAAPEMAESTRV